MTTQEQSDRYMANLAAITMFGIGTTLVIHELDQQGKQVRQDLDRADRLLSDIKNLRARIDEILT
jgi:hypothetical protein